MILSGRSVGTAAVFSVLVFVATAATAASNTESSAEAASEGHAKAEHEYHENHFGGFLGASTDTETNETGFTLGLDYARQFHTHWNVVGYIEQVSGDRAREVIVAFGVTYYVTRRLALVLAPGVEFASEGVDHDGQIEVEDETEFLGRLSAAYRLPLGKGALGPVVFADYAGNSWSIGYGLGMMTGF